MIILQREDSYYRHRHIILYECILKHLVTGLKILISGARC